MSTASDALDQALLKAQNYREFIQLAMQGDNSAKALSFGEVARRAGFASRSYVRDIVAGRKRVSAKTLPRLVRAFNLSGDRKLYFSLMVFLEEPDLREASMTSERIKARMDLARKRLGRRSKEATSVLSSAETLFDDRRTSQVFAAVHIDSDGATLESVARLTKLTEQSCGAILERLVARGVIELREDRYYCNDAHLVFDGLHRDYFFKRAYLTELSHLKQCVETNFDRRDHLFLKSTFTIPAAKAQQLREELRKLMVQFIDDTSGTPDDDSLANLVVGFMPAGAL